MQMEAAAVDVGVAVGGSLLAKIKRHFAYLYKYKDNLKALEDARVQLDSKRTDGSRFSEDCNTRLKDVSATVSQWQSDANELHQTAENKISNKNISRLNLWSRYTSSKRAWELTQDINKKVESAPNFGTSFDRSIAEGDKFILRGFLDFKSRLGILDAVLEALKDDDVTMCSICGMGGIGKTTMAKKLVQIVEADGLFDNVSMVTVSQNPNFEKIQNEIIELLGLKLNESSMPGKAKKLNYWLSSEKSLLILDDVWWQLHDEDFEKVGIPLAHKGCKIVLTSRNEDECKKMRSQPNFRVNVLDDGEARDLFVQYAEKSFEDRNLQEMARKMVDECDGLPIAIVTIARALKDKPVGVWKDSLRKLQKSNLQGISGMEKVYSRIQLSYDLLNDREAQSFFHLCCLFPEDYDIQVKKLLFYGWGLELFEGVDSLKDARDRVESIVDKLKKSFLLLDGEKGGCIKLHDIVRDFLIFITSKDEYSFLVRCGEEMENWPETQQHEKSSAISFVYKEIKKVSDRGPIDLRFSNFKLLQLHFKYYWEGDLPVRICEGTKELRVVDLNGPSTLAGLALQKKLRTLLIAKAQHGYPGNVSPIYFREMLGDMKNVEILSLSGMRLLDFPIEIGQLCNLRCLKLSSFSVTLEYIPPGVLSKLVKLEELKLPPQFRNWGLKEEGGDRVNASLDELESLPLTTIQISISNCSILAETLVKRITRFQIPILPTKMLYMDHGYDMGSNVLAVEEVAARSVTENWMSILVRKCDRLLLERLGEWKYIMFPCTYYSQLKTLKIAHMDCLEEILDGPYLSNTQQPCFSNLTEVQIRSCPKLKWLFPLSVASELSQLESLDMRDCAEMEEIFYEDKVDQVQMITPIKTGTTLNKHFGSKDIAIHQISEENIEKVDKRHVDRKITLPRLKLLRLERMDKLRVLCNGNHAIEYPSLEELIVEKCNNMEALSFGLLSAPRIKKLEIKGVRYLKNIFRWLNLEQDNGIPHLKEVQIEECQDMEYLVDRNLPKAFLSSLEKLSIIEISSLKKIWLPCFGNLTDIFICKCQGLKRLFPLSVAIELRQLERMVILYCEQMEEIFYEDQEDDENQLSAPTASPPSNPNNEKSRLVPPTRNSLFQDLLHERKEQVHIPTRVQTMEESTAKVDRKEVRETIMDSIILPQLRELELWGLSELRIFYNGIGGIELPSLQKLAAYECKKLEVLSKGSFKAPIVKEIKTTYRYHDWVEDLNIICRDR